MMFTSTTHNSPTRPCHPERSEGSRLAPTSGRITALPLAALLVLGFAISSATLIAADTVSGESIRERIRVLASDEFEGRAPASAGEEKTVNFLVSEFKKAGLKPGNPDGTYIQSVPMMGVTSTIETTFSARTELKPEPINEYTARSRRTVPSVSVKDSPIIFCGYGVQAPEYKWDDFKGVDMRGATIVVLVNDPPQRDPKDPSKLDDAMFKGRAMTYYGRWDYKYTQAAAVGAAACLIVHETGPAGYPFAVLGSRWAQEEFDLLTPDGNAKDVAVQGWLTVDFARKLFAEAGQDYDALKAVANDRNFRPVPLKARASFAVQNKLRNVTSRNVIAKVEGSDAKLKDEYVIYTAHWDHLGRDNRLKGDQIFNGAFDNASGTAALVEIAGAFAAQKPAPRRTVLFLAVTAEERGLLGAEYYAANPLYPLEKTVANINMDRIQVFGRSRDLEIIGYGNSTIDDLAASILKRSNRVVVPDTAPEKGYFYRSDHFEFAKKGVPAFYSKFGKDLLDYPPGTGQKLDEAYTASDYHKVSDDLKPNWDFRGAAEDVKFLVELGQMIANGDRWPEWKPGTEFKARRDEMLRAKR